jgi:branched-chain amino acid transport system permease protein
MADGDRGVPMTVYAGIVILILLVVPLFIGSVPTRYLSEILILGLFAMAYDYMYGYTGMVSFGHAAPFGLGAYTIALPITRFGFDNLLVLLVLAFVVALLYGFIVGWISMGTADTYFAILTLAFAQIVFLIFDHMSDYTGGDDGVPVTLPDLFGYSMYDRTVFYYFAAVVCVASMYVLYRLVQSPLGAVLKGVRENRQRMKYLGYNERYYRISAFTVSCGFSGIAGALLAMSASFTHPDFLFFIRSGEVVVYTVIGGAGTLFGPILGAALVYMAEELLSGVVEWWLIPVGILLILVMIYAPGGIWGIGERIRDRLLGDEEEGTA